MEDGKEVPEFAKQTLDSQLERTWGLLERANPMAEGLTHCNVHPIEGTLSDGKQTSYLV